jgi:hypothetical protein
MNHKAASLGLAVVLVGLCWALPQPACAETYGFSNITGDSATNAATGEAQLSVDVGAGGAGQVRFDFHNVGAAACSITDVYFDDGVLLGIASIINGAGVQFAQYASPSNLPGGTNVDPDFQTTAGFSADSDPPTQSNGVNPGESLGIVFNLKAGATLQGVLDSLADRTLRIGIHVQAFANGGSESFVNIPGPAQGPDQCVAPGQAFVPMDLDPYLPPGAPSGTSWSVSSQSDPAPPNVAISDGVATITYPEGFIGCRNVLFLAKKYSQVYASVWARFSVAPSPVVGDIPDQQSCDDISFDLDDYLSGGVTPGQVEWTYEGAVALVVQIDPDTHVVTISNGANSCEPVSETVTFRACLRRVEDCHPECPAHCWECDEDQATFTFFCDEDNDGVADACDICPGYNDNVDSDDDGVPDGCDICPGYNDNVDSDDDGVPDGCDICPGYNDNVDSDDDGVPDGCDICPGYNDNVDSDDDGVPDGCDICPGHNDNVDSDDDGVPDGCDICPGHDDNVDSDDDGVPDGCDNCPDVSNPDQTDTDGDGVGDACNVPPAPQPCPDCPTPDEMLAVGWFCPGAAAGMTGLLLAGIFALAGPRRRP